MISTGQWRSPRSLDRFAALTEFKHVTHVTFYDGESIERESRALRSLGRSECSDTYGLMSSGKDRQARVELPLLDPDAALIIVLNMDEEAVLLDYRGGGSPSVVCTVWDDNGPIRYRQIASCFEDFANAIGLSPTGS